MPFGKRPKIRCYSPMQIGSYIVHCRAPLKGRDTRPVITRLTDTRVRTSIMIKKRLTSITLTRLYKCSKLGDASEAHRVSSLFVGLSRVFSLSFFILFSSYYSPFPPFLPYLPPGCNLSPSESSKHQRHRISLTILQRPFLHTLSADLRRDAIGQFGAIYRLSLSLFSWG